MTAITKTFSERYGENDIYTYTMKGDIEVDISTQGATLLALRTPDRNGVMTDVLLGFERAQDRIYSSGYMGAVIGRIGNRIGDGRFTLEGKEYTLALNDGGKAHLHGGNAGFNQKNFTVEESEGSLLFSCFSPDGEEGYPADLSLTVKYTISGKALVIEYFAKSNGTTVFSPTNHAYFNLNGESDGSVLDNVLCIKADAYLPVDGKLIPTGEERDVSSTAFDFREPKEIGRDIGADDAQLATAGGYDHNFCLSDPHFAYAYSKKTGIRMDCYTDRCGVQFYSGNFLDGGRGKSVYNRRSGFCLETQLYPDAVNKPQWNSPVLKEGENFYSKTEYVFSVEE